jgi:LEA14-like dessication related protein
MALQSKMTVYAAIGGVFALMGGIVFFTSDNVDLDQVEIVLTSVQLREINSANNQAKLDVTFLIKNPSDTTLTVSTIDYQLYGNGVLFGSGLYSTADIAMPGRAAVYSGAEVPLKNMFILSKSDDNSEIYEDVINDKITSFTAEGRIITQTSWSESEKEFKSGY